MADALMKRCMAILPERDGNNIRLPNVQCKFAATSDDPRFCGVHHELWQRGRFNPQYGQRAYRVLESAQDAAPEHADSADRRSLG